jgi:hypothetical protein
VIFGGHSTGSMHGYWLSGAWSCPGIWHDEVWRNLARDSRGCRTGIRSRFFARKAQCAACSVIRVYGLSGLIGTQKNDLRRMWAIVPRDVV